MNRAVFKAIAALAILVLSGCAGQKPLVPFHYSPEISSILHLPKDLETRLLDYWTRKSNGMVKDAYEMEAPYIREITPFSIYANIFSKATPVENMEILRITHVSDHYYTITLHLFFKNPNGEAKKTVLTDRWVKADDTWFHVIIDPVFKNYFP